jgi:hypothetical protein
MENMNNDNLTTRKEVMTPDRRLADFYREKAIFYANKWAEAENNLLRKLVDENPEFESNVIYLTTMGER